MLKPFGEEAQTRAVPKHHFTAFAQKIVRLVETRSDNVVTPFPVARNATPIFLMNAPNNRHKLAVRILSNWLGSRGEKVRLVEDDVDYDKLLRSIAAEQPRYLLISMALIDQRASVAEIAERVQAVPEGIRPKVIIGGYPIKTGLIRAIPNAELQSNVSALDIGQPAA